MDAEGEGGADEASLGIALGHAFAEVLGDMALGPVVAVAGVVVGVVAAVGLLLRRLTRNVGFGISIGEHGSLTDRLRKRFGGRG